MEHFGEVIEQIGDKRAQVKIRHQTSCSSCGRCGGIFGNPEKENTSMVEAINPIGAAKGQLVKLVTRDSEVLLAAFLLYILPLIGLLGGLFAGRAMAMNWGLDGSPDLWGFGLGLIVMVLVFLVLRYQEKNMARSRRFKAEIAEIVNEKEIPEELRP